MSVSYFKNFFNFPFWKPTEEELKDIPYPTTELIVHVTYKTVEMMSLLSGWVVAPIYTVVRRSKLSPDVLASKVRRIHTGGLLLGVVMGPAMTMARLRSSNSDAASIYDRCYRLRHNTTINPDRAVTILAPLGLVFGGISGLVHAINVGTIAGGLYNKIAPKASPTPTETAEKSSKKGV